jgi:GTP-binding protein LepA
VLPAPSVLTVGTRGMQDARVGDTITLRKCAADVQQLPGYAEAKPQVFCGLFPVDADEYTNLREALGKLQLNDAALSFEPEVSSAMGFGFRCGFLGMLHMDIVQVRQRAPAVLRRHLTRSAVGGRSTVGYV